MKFKKILSAALAAVMAASVMSVGMVSVASAADGDDFTLKAEDLDASKFTEKKLPINGATVEISNTSNTLSPYGTYSSSVKNESGKTFTNELKLGGGRTITITPAATGTITMYWYDNGGSKDVKIGDNNYPDSTNNEVKSGFSPCLAGTPLVITTSGSNICLLEIDFAKGGDFAQYTINGTATGLEANDKFTIGTYEATVQEGGTWSVTTTNELKDGAVLPISKGGYTAEPASVTLKGSSPFNVGTIAFTQIPWEDITEGDHPATELAAGHPNFDISDADVTSVTNNPDAFRVTGTVKMQFTSAATVTITGHCPSTTTTKYVNIKLGDLDVTEYGTDPVSQDKDFTAKVGPGVQSLVITTAAKPDDTSLQISKINVKYDSSAEPPVDDGNANITIGQIDNQYVVVGVDKPENCGDIQLYAINSASEDAQAVIEGNHPVGVSIDTVYQAVTGIDKAKLPVSGYVFAQEVANGKGNNTFAAKSADGKTSGTVQITQGEGTTPGGGENTSGDGYEIVTDAPTNPAAAVTPPGPVTLPYSIDFSTDDARNKMLAVEGVTSLKDATLDNIVYKLNHDYKTDGNNTSATIGKNDYYIAFTVDKDVNLTVTLDPAKSQNFYVYGSSNGTYKATKSGAVIPLEAGGTYTITAVDSEVDISKISIDPQA